MSHVDPFNALGGFSVGIPPELVIDETGNVVNNVNAPNANVTANRVFANSYFYANGSPLSIGAAGANTQVQYNNAGLLGASSAFTFNSATNLLTVSKLQVGNTANLGNVSNVVILGGTNGYFLQTDGAGNLTWAPAGNGGNTGNGVPGGANTQVQFNDAGVFGGDAGFTYNKTSQTLTVANNITATNNITGTNLSVATGNVSGNLIVGNIQAENITLSANVTNANWIFASYFAGNGHNLFAIVGANVVGQVGFANVANNVAGANVSGQVGFANVANNVAGANVSGQVSNALVSGTVYTAAQPNITSVGNLTSLVVIGNTTLGNQVTSNYFIGNLYGTANLARNVTLPAQPNITSLGTLTGLTVTGTTTLGNTVTANYFVGNLYGVANSATIANVANLATLANNATLANAANIAGTVTVNAQPNITSLGTLTSLNVTGNITAGNANLGNLTTANFVSGTLTTAAQPNITSVGTLTGLIVNGNLSATNISGNGSGLTNIQGSNIVGVVPTANHAYTANLANTVVVAAQPNITSLGNLTSLTVNGLTSLGSVSNVRISGGTNGYVLSTDGVGNLSWIAQSNGGGNANAAGSNTQLQFNNAGSFGASANLTFNSATNLLFVQGFLTVANTINASSLVSNTITSNSLINNGNITSGNVNAGNLLTANFVTGTLTTHAQPNISSVGNLGWLNVDTAVSGGNGNIIFNGSMVGSGAASNIDITGNINAGAYVEANYFVGQIASANQPNITAVGTLTSLNVNGVSNLGNVANFRLLGGTNGYVLATDGTGNLSWVAQANGGGGNGTPAGSNTQIQFNNAGSFGASANLFYNSTTGFLYVGGNSTFTQTVNASSFVSNTISSNSATVVGNITAGNVNAGNLLTANFISGTLTTNTQTNINYLGNVGWLNVDTAIAGGNGNIRFNGSLVGSGAASSIDITGNINAGTYVEANYFVGQIASANQPNITSIGNLTSLTVVGNSNLGNVGNIKIAGGNANYVLSTDGAGNLSWVAQTGGGGNVTPGGLNTYIQFNDNGNLGGNANFTFNKTTSNLFVNGNANITGTLTSQTLVSRIATGSPPLVVDSTTPVANLAVDTAATVRSAAQPNITSVGTLTSLSVSGNVSAANINVTNTFSTPNLSVTGTIGTSNLNVTGLANFSSNAYIHNGAILSVNGNINANNSANVNLGNVSNIHIYGGLNGYVLSTDGAGNLIWAAGGGGGNGTPGGSNTQVQYNKAGTFAGNSAFTFNESTSNLQIAGNLIANTVTVGSGIYAFSHTKVYSATTNSIAEQVILSIDAADVAAVDYTIISTDGIIRNFIKISAVVNGSSLNYVEYSTLPVNGYTGDFTVAYDAGNIITPASIQLKMSPQSANVMSHKMSVTTYKA